MSLLPEQVPSHESVLGFGDLRGFYDFDTMSMAFDVPEKESGEVISLSDMILFAHERNHWHQQITSSFGNITTNWRGVCLHHSWIIWRQLDTKFREEVLKGRIVAPLSSSLKSDRVTLDSLPLNSEGSTKSIQSCMKVIRAKLGANRALAKTDWIEDSTRWWIEIRALALGLTSTDPHSALSQDESKATVELSVNEEINIARLAFLTDDWLQELSDRKERPASRLWDASWLLEASCVSQEFLFASIKSGHDSEKWADARFEEISTGNYAGPIRQVIEALNLEWCKQSIRLCASLITILVEIAINPPVPPRTRFSGIRYMLSDIHPSLRFERLISILKEGSVDPAHYGFKEFDSPHPDDNFLVSYLDECVSLAQQAGLTIRHIMKRSVWGEYESFKLALDRVEAMNNAPDTAMSHFIEIYKLYKGVPQNFVQNCGYISRFAGAIHLQNSIIAQAHHESGRLVGTSRYYLNERTGLNTRALNEVTGWPVNTYLNDQEGGFTHGGRFYEMLKNELRYKSLIFNGLFNHQVRKSATNIPISNDADLIEFFVWREEQDYGFGEYG